MIKSNGGVFGRNPTFNDVTVEGELVSTGGATVRPNASASAGIVVLGPLAGAAIQNSATNDVAIGASAMLSAQTASNSIAIGTDALRTVTTGGSNCAIGGAALRLNTGSNNIALGVSALENNGSTGFAVAVGHASLLYSTASTNCVSIGANAGRYRGSGTDTMTSATSSVFIGHQSRAAAAAQTNQVVIAGTDGLGNGSNTTTLGNSSTTGTFIPAGNLTLSNGNLILGTAGNGIDFSADANAAGMTSELLDDYEEGTWTPLYASESGAFTTMTMSTVGALYTKIGRQVFVWADVRTNNVDVGSASGFIRITGLPFTEASGNRSSGSIGNATGWAGETPMTLGMFGSNYIVPYFRSAVDGAASTSQAADMTTGASTNANRMTISISYVV